MIINTKINVDAASYVIPRTFVLSYTLSLSVYNSFRWKLIWNIQNILSIKTDSKSFLTYQSLAIKTHGRVSVAKKAVWYTSVLFTGIANLPFSTPYISIITGPIFIKFTYFMSSIYTTLHTKLEINWPSSLWDMCS